jgi:hypothetical protein
VTKSILDRLADPSKPDVNNACDTYAWASQRSLLWQGIDLKQGIISTSVPPLSWIRPQDI